jgi:heptaprenylglyceryl phosphate synthase
MRSSKASMLLLCRVVELFDKYHSNDLDIDQIVDALTEDIEVLGEEDSDSRLKENLSKCRDGIVVGLRLRKEEMVRSSLQELIQMSILNSWREVTGSANSFEGSES